MTRGRFIVCWWVGLVVGSALALHVALLVAWRVSIEPELAAAPRGARLEAEEIAAFPAPRPGWPALAFGDLRLRAPVVAAVADAQARCRAGCRLPLAQGTLTLFAARRTEGYAQTIHLLVPERQDAALTVLDKLTHQHSEAP